MKAEAFSTSRRAKSSYQFMTLTFITSRRVVSSGFIAALAALFFLAPAVLVSAAAAQYCFPVPSYEYGLCVPTTVLHKAALLILDTGTTIDILDDHFKALLGEPVQFVRAETPDGHTIMPIYQQPLIRIGPFVMSSNANVGMLDMTWEREVIDRPICGILGMTSLSQYAIAVSIDSHTACIMTGPGDTNGYSTVLSLQGGARQTRTVTIGLPVGEAQFMIDTGYFGDAVINTSLFETLLKDGYLKTLPPRRVANAATVVTRQRARLSAIKIAGYIATNIIVTKAHENILGLGYLSRFDYLLAFSSKRLYIKPSHQFSKVERVNWTGLSLIRKGTNVIINTVYADSPAAEAGLQPGQLVVEINGLSSRVNTLQRLRAEFRRPHKHTCHLLLRSTKGKHIYQIDLRPKQ